MLLYFLAEAVATLVSFVLDLRIRYVGDSAPVEKMVDVAPEVEKHVVRAISSHVNLVSVKSHDDLSFIHFV